MSRQVRYRGSFADKEGVKWEVQILQKAEEPFAKEGRLTFPYENPLTLEWGDTAKEEPICSSTATLRIVSRGDRTYQNLYTIAPGEVSLKVYRDGKIYWTGCIDPEFYEEPYSFLNNYEVELTFSDMGILSRIPFQKLEDFITIREIIESCNNLSGLNALPLDESLVTTLPLYEGSDDKGNPYTFIDTICVRSDNFIDEEDEPLNWYEVLEGVLQPLGLKIIQRAGKLVLFDLNGAATKGKTAKVKWAGTDAVMGVDKVYNKLEITFSPYADSTLLEGDNTFFPEYFSRLTLEEGANAVFGIGRLPIYGFFEKDKRTQRYDSFDISFANEEGTEDETSFGYINFDCCRLFHMLPNYDGEEIKGIAATILYDPSPAYSYSEGMYDLEYQLLGGEKIKMVSPVTSNTLFTTKRFYLPPCADNTRCLRIKMSMLFDARYNPFRDKEGDLANKKIHDYYKKVEEKANYICVPVRIDLYNVNGDCTKRYVPSTIPDYSGPYTGKGSKFGSWKSKSDAPDYGYLAYYNQSLDTNDKKSVQGGWVFNRLYRSADGINDLNGKLYPEGQFVSYPPEGGYIEISVLQGLTIYDKNGTVFTPWEKKQDYDYYKYIRWLLYKTPSVEIVKLDYPYDSIEVDDVIYDSYINKFAEDDLKLDTICGTADTELSNARGQFVVNTAGKEQVQTLTRAGRTTQAEELLAGTLYSQYSGRKTRLNGTAQIEPTPTITFTESMQRDRVFLMTADTQNPLTGESEMQITELSADVFDKEK